MAPCCGAPSGCVWDDVVGWHLAASDKRASAGSIPSEILLNFFFFLGGGLTECPGRPLARIFFFTMSEGQCQEYTIQ